MNQSLSYISLSISFIAILFTAINLWLNHLRKGNLITSQPSSICFCPDGKFFEDRTKMKVVIQNCLYSTSEQGHLVESLYVQLRNSNSVQKFHIWVFGNEGNLVRKSGLYISKKGFAASHHFLICDPNQNYNFSEGNHELNIFANLVGYSRGKKLEPIKLLSINLNISHDSSMKLKNDNTALYFDWDPDNRNYHASIKTKSESYRKEKTLDQIIDSIIPKI